MACADTMPCSTIAITEPNASSAYTIRNSSTSSVVSLPCDCSSTNSSVLSPSQNTMINCDGRGRVTRAWGNGEATTGKRTHMRWRRGVGWQGGPERRLTRLASIMSVPNSTAATAHIDTAWK